MTLSVFALGASIAGTQWLSDQTGSSAERLAARAVHHVAAHPVAVNRIAHRSHTSSKHVLADLRPRYTSAPARMPVAPVVSHGDAVAWVPVSMPVSSIPFARIRHHDAGNLVLHLVVDGQGQVAQATLAQSSGDAVLDADALAIARQWRFAVPPDHPHGFSGDLPLSFSAAATAQFAQTP
jgi:periplasmic protein TonB